MSRIDHIKKRLEAWARWSTTNSGGLGYPKASAFTRLTPRSASAAGFLPTDSEALQTEKAVLSLLPHHIDLWHTLQAYYIKGYDIARCARVLSVAESSIKARLCRADAVLDAWLTEQTEVVAKAKKNFDA